MYPSRHSLEYLSEMDKLFSRNHEFDLHSPMLSTSSNSFHSIIPSSSSTETSPESYPDVTTQRQFQRQDEQVLFDYRQDRQDTFERRPNICERRPDNFQKRSDLFEKRSDTPFERSDVFERRPDNFQRSPDAFVRSDNHRRADTPFERSDVFERRPDNFQRSPDAFVRSDNYRRADTPFERSDVFERRPDNFQRSPDAFVRSDNYRRSDTPFERSDVFERRPENFQRSPDAFVRSDNYRRRSDTPFERSDTFDRSDIYERRFDDQHREVHDTPFIIRKQRPIIGRKIMATTELPKIQESNVIWQPIEVPQTPPKSNIYELFPMESKGFEIRSPVKSPSYSSSPMTLSPIQVPSPSLTSSPKITASPNIMRTPPRLLIPSPSLTPFSHYDRVPGTSANYQAAKMCTFCKKNGETPLVYMAHSVKEKVGNKNIVTCPILRRHVCATCGASGDNAHTITYCPVLRSSNNGQPLRSTTITLKNTRVKSNGRRRY